MLRQAKQLKDCKARRVYRYLKVKRNNETGNCRRVNVVAIPFAVALMCPLLLNAETASEVSQLLESTRTISNQLSRDVTQMESLTRSKVTWQSHSAQIEPIRNHINQAGKLVGQLEETRAGAARWQQDAIDRITPLLKEMASNTDSIIDHLNKAKRVWDPSYQEYLRANHELADELAKTIGDF